MELRLAVIDDDISIRKILVRIIKEAELGDVVVECADGSEAEHVLRKENVDIALIDMLLPGQDGVELIKRLTAAGLASSYIMISQVNSEPMITRAYQSGIEFFIHKPINVLEVLSVIRKVSESRKLRQFMSYIHQTTVRFSRQESPSANGEEEDRKAGVYRLFSDLGILGEAGAKDIYLLIDRIAAYRGREENDYQMNELYGQLSQQLKQDARTIEQRVRRTVAKALQNLASLGIEDYYNEKFQNYSTSLFEFKEVRQEMNFINGKSTYHGKINIKKFIEGVLFATGQVS